MSCSYWPQKHSCSVRNGNVSKITQINKQAQRVDSAGFTSAAHLYKTKGTVPRAVTSHSSTASQLRNQLRYTRYLDRKYF